VLDPFAHFAVRNPGARVAADNVATAYSGTVVISTTDTQASLPTNYTFAAADNGVHTLAVTLRTAGAQSLTATDSVTAGFTDSITIQVVAAAAAYLSLVPAQNTIYPGQLFAMTVTAFDAFGNIARGYLGTVHFASSDPAAALPADYQFAAADGSLHTFTGFELNTPGDQTITVSDTLNPTLTITVYFQFQNS
jgi:hypothetical protein